MKASLFGLGMVSGTPVVTAKYLQNFYLDYRPRGEKTQVVAIGFPGLDLFADAGDTKWRGGIAVEQNDLSYGVHRGTFYEINNAGVLTSRGTIGTVTGDVDMAHNGSVVMFIDGEKGYTYTIATTTVAEITSDFPDNPTSVTWQDGYFIAGFDDGTFYISSDAITWDALDFASAESNPDRLVRVFSDHGELVLFGDISTEFWGNSGATDFPYSKMQGADAEWGLAARWSVAKFDNSIAFLCKNRMGQVIVGKISGHSVIPISTPDLDGLINAYAVTSDAVSHSYLLNGHPMYQINFPSAGKSWSYDGRTKQWSPRKSYRMTRHRCDKAWQFLSKTILTDESNGRLYRLNPMTLNENGEPIEGEIVGEHWDGELQNMTIDRLRLDMEVGTGVGTEGSITTWDGEGTIWDDGETLWDYQRAIPCQVMLSISKDGGKTYGNEMWRSAGHLGDYTRVVTWRRLGGSTRLTAKFRLVDDFRRVIIGVYINPPN